MIERRLQQFGTAVSRAVFHIKAVELISNRINCASRMAVLVAIISALKKTPVLPGMVILGDEKMRAAVYEIAVLGRGGLDVHDTTPKYALKSMPGQFTGLRQWFTE